MNCVGLELKLRYSSNAELIYFIAAHPTGKQALCMGCASPFPQHWPCWGGDVRCAHLQQNLVSAGQHHLRAWPVLREGQISQGSIFYWLVFH